MSAFLIFCGVMIGFALQPFAEMLFEWVLFRPRRKEPDELCKGCTIS